MLKTLEIVMNLRIVNVKQNKLGFKRKLMVINLRNNRKPRNFFRKIKVEI